MSCLFASALHLHLKDQLDVPFQQRSLEARVAGQGFRMWLNNLEITFLYWFKWLTTNPGIIIFLLIHYCSSVVSKFDVLATCAFWEQASQTSLPAKINLKFFIATDVAVYLHRDWYEGFFWLTFRLHRFLHTLEVIEAFEKIFPWRPLLSIEKGNRKFLETNGLGEEM